MSANEASQAGSARGRGLGGRWRSRIDEHDKDEAPVLAKLPEASLALRGDVGRGRRLLVRDQANALPVRLLGHGHDPGCDGSQLGTNFLGDDDLHLRHIDLERVFQAGRDIERDPGKLAVLVHRPQTIPAAALDHAVAPVDVETLLTIPLLRAAGGGVRSGSRKHHLVRKNVGLDAHEMRCTVALYPYPLQWEPLCFRLSTSE